MKKIFQKACSILLAAAIALALFPLNLLSLSGSVVMAEGVCAHTHGVDCGYAAPVAGALCGHAHDDGCGWDEETQSGCSHAHNGACGFVEAKAGQPCTHTHDENCGNLPSDTKDDPEPDGATGNQIGSGGSAPGEEAEASSSIGDNGTGAAVVSDMIVIAAFDGLAEEILRQTYALGEITGLKELNLPTELMGEDAAGAPIVLVEVAWESTPAFDLATPGEYPFTAVLPVGYVLADGVEAPEIAVTVSPAAEDLALLAVRDGSVIDMSDGTIVDGDSGEVGADLCWTYADSVYTILDGASVTVTGSNAASQRRLKVASGASADITLDGASIDVNATANACAFDMAGATVNLTLSGTNMLKSGANCAGLQASDGSRLTISGSGTNILTATGYSGAGIGGGNGEAGGKITINGGRVNARGNGNGAGIGGGCGGAGGNITINGGEITASGSGAGIGGGGFGAGDGDRGGDCGSISITGGRVYATGAYGAGVGSGDYAFCVGSIKISGGTVNAAGGYDDYGIGGGYDSFGNVEIEITGGALTAKSSSYRAIKGTITALPSRYTYWTNMDDEKDPGGSGKRVPSSAPYENGGYKFVKIKASVLTPELAIIGTPNTGWEYTGDVLIIRQSGTYSIAMVTPGATTDHCIVVASGLNATITLDGVRIDMTEVSEGCAFYLAPSSGTTTLALSGNNTLTSGEYRAGLEVPPGAKLRITGGPADTLTVTGNAWCAGIGGCADGEGSGDITVDGGRITAKAGTSGSGIGLGNTGVRGNITISGGEINAEGGGSSDGAGIGGGGVGGLITISGGKVNAEGGSAGGAGIGGGKLGNGGQIVISGGEVVAKAGTSGAGIGGGLRSVGFNIAISGGVITASGDSGGAGIGGGLNGSGGDIIISGGEVTAVGDYTYGPAIGNGDGGVGGTITMTGGRLTAQGYTDMNRSAINSTLIALPSAYTYWTGRSCYDPRSAGTDVPPGPAFDNSGSYSFVRIIPSPTAVSVTPTAAGAAVSGKVVITFSEPMDTSAGTVQLNNLAALTEGVWSAGNTVLTVPYSSLEGLTAYTVHLSGFKGMEGNGMPADSSHAFTTAIIPPKTVSVGTQNGALSEGVAGSASFLVTTANIASGTAITLNNINDVPGISLGTPATTNDSINVSISTTAATPEGTHPLTLTIDGVTSGSFGLCVGPHVVILVESITVTGAGGARAITAPGGTLQMHAEAQPANADDRAVIWSVAGGTGSATISTSGLLTAVANGTVRVQATAQDGSGVYGALQVTISGQPAVTGVTVSPSISKVKRGATQAFDAIVAGTNGFNSAVTWTVEGGSSAGTTVTGGTLSVAPTETAEALTVRATSLQDPRKSGTAAVTVLDSDALEKITIQGSRAVTLEQEEKRQHTFDYEPDPTAQTGVIWSSNNEAVAEVDQNGLVTAKETGQASIAVRSNHNPGIYDYIWVRVVPKEADVPEPAFTIAWSGGDVTNGRIVEDFEKDRIIRLTASTAVTWNSSDTKVATVNADGDVKQVAPGIATITATCKAGINKGETATVMLTIRDIMPRLPLGTLTLYTKSNGVLFTVLPTDTFTFDHITTETDGFTVEKVNGTSYVLKTSRTAKGKHTVALKAKDIADQQVGVDFTLTVNVVIDIPKASVKMPTLNTFWRGASGQITFNGKDLPGISRVILVDSVNPAKDGKVTENFTVTPGGLITAVDIFTSFTDAQGTKPAVKGILEIYYEGFGENCSRVNVTVSIKDTVPKLALKPAAQTINIAHGFDAAFEIVGGKLDNIVSTAATANSVIQGIHTIDDTSFAVTLSSSAKATRTLQLEAWLQGANKPIIIKPTVKTVGASTYKLSATTVTLSSASQIQRQLITIIPSASNETMRAINIDSQSMTGITVARNPANDWELVVDVPQFTPAGTYKFNIRPNWITNALVLTVKVVAQTPTVIVKAEKGNIDLMNQGNTLLVYTPALKNTGLRIGGVDAAPSMMNTSDDRMVVGNPVGKDDYLKFDVKWNAESQKVEVRTLPGEKYRKGASYKLQLRFALTSADGTHNGETVSTGDITIKPAQSAVKHNLPKTLTLHQGRTTVYNHAVIDLKPTTPVGARIDTLGFKKETNSGRFINNPGNAYWYYFDDEAQELHVWIRDGALVKPGKATLVFSATYIGQGIENLGSQAAKEYKEKPVDIKISVTIVK